MSSQRDLSNLFSALTRTARSQRDAHHNQHVRRQQSRPDAGDLLAVLKSVVDDVYGVVQRQDGELEALFFAPGVLDEMLGRSVNTWEFWVLVQHCLLEASALPFSREVLVSALEDREITRQRIQSASCPGCNAA